MRFLLLTAASLLASASSALAHPGGLDARGCHANRKTGEYHCHPSSPAPRARQDLQDSDSNCGSKYYCKDLASCSEAIHYLKDCGLTRLDGDGDGVPCETLCGRN